MADSPRCLIVISENGPYVVTGQVTLTRRAPAVSTHGEPLEWDLVGAEGVDYEMGERYELCRCGRSKDKPFCDGTHQAVDFDGTLTAERGPSVQRRKTFVGTGIVMTDDPTLFAAAGFCRTRYTDVWKMISATGDPESRERLKRMVANCPSGRLQFSLRESSEAVELEYKPSISTIVDGPLWAQGGIELRAPHGFRYEPQNRMTLCR